MPTIIINSVSKLGSSLCFDLIPDKMFVRRYLGFVLLVWFQGVLYVQASNQPCSAPSLNGGYLVPEQDTYIHETKLSYGCDNGHKPAVEGWWATSTCENGKWSHKPQCIDEKACVPPTFPNAIYTVRTNGWYGENDIIRITCDNGYEYKGWDATAQCINGSWSSVPVCEKSIHACGEPPQIPHAVIILQGYQDFFAVDTKLQYECEDGFTLEGANTTPYIYCIGGNWTDSPVCNPEQGAGLGVSADVGTGGRQTTSAGRGVQPEVSIPGTGHGQGSAGRGTSPAGGASRPGTGHGQGSAGRDTSTAGGGSAGRGTSTAGGVSIPGTGHGQGSAGRGTSTAVKHCGAPPQVPNGDVVQTDELFLRYQCNSFYTQVGSDTVTCDNNGSWSQLPICEERFCVLNPRLLVLLYGLESEVKYIKEGEDFLSCIWPNYFSRVKCTNRELSFTRCCRSYEHDYGRCK